MGIFDRAKDAADDVMGKAQDAVGGSSQADQQDDGSLTDQVSEQADQQDDTPADSAQGVSLTDQVQTLDD